MITDARCKLEYLPPYSPDYNPIEYTFSVIKSHFKRSSRLTRNEINEELAEKAVEIAKEVVTSEIARNEFRHCRVNIDY
jgi:transposase